MLPVMQLTAVALLTVAWLAWWPNTGTADPAEDDAVAVKLDPDYAAGKQALNAKDWPAAIKSLNAAALHDTRNADMQNSLGYAYRNAGQLALAFRHYHRALQLNPRHRGAHEYAGEAYLIVHKLAKAEEHLAGHCQLNAKNLYISAVRTHIPHPHWMTIHLFSQGHFAREPQSPTVVAQFIAVCRWSKLLHKERLVLL